MVNKEALTQSIKEFLEELIKESDDSLKVLSLVSETPEKVSQLWLEKLLDGYKKDPINLIKGGRTLFSSTSSEVVIIKKVGFYSFCPHHLLPYRGYFDLSYIHDGYILGFSRIVEVVDSFAHRFILQEELTQRVVDAITENLPAKACLCRIRSTHLCQFITNGGRETEIETIGFSGAEKFRQLLEYSIGIK